MGDYLTLGSFELTADDGTTLVLAEGTTRGNPVPIEVAVKSWLQDGAVVVTQGYDNREIHIRVRFFGSDLVALADTEAALFAELGKPNTLTWTPSDGFGPSSVFEVVTSSLDFDDSDDTGEGQYAPWRTYNLRLLCEAFVRSSTETTASALAANGTTTTNVDACSSTTGWTGAINGVSTTPSLVSGTLVLSTSNAAGIPMALEMTHTGSITTSSTKYLVVDWKPESLAGDPTLRAFGDTIELGRAGEAASPTAGYTRTWFGPVAASSIAALRLLEESDRGPLSVGSTTRSLTVDNIDRTDIKPQIGTARQLLRTISVSGSAPTSGSLAIEHASSALGDVLAYFFPDAVNAIGYSPPLRQYRVSGSTVTADATLVSGSRESISPGGGGAAVVFDVPLSRLAPGVHLIALRMKTGGITTTTFTWSAQLRINGTNVGSAASGSATRNTSTTYTAQTIYAIGRVVLPTTDVDIANTNGVMRITLSITDTVFSGCEFDEAWIFNTSIGQLIQASCGTASPASGGSSNRLFIEPPTPAQPRPVLRAGFAADRTDSAYPTNTSAWQLPRFVPPRVNVFTVTTNALDASVTLRHFPRWHSHAGA